MCLPDLKEARQLVERVESTKLVFRVFDDHSHQTYQPNAGFVADVDLSDLSNFDEVEKSVRQRLVFGNWQPTPWISTTRRWLWAVWEANRRYNRSKGELNIRIVVINLDACLVANEGVSIPSLGYKCLPFIHALSGLSRAEINFKRFADMSDEILIYRKVPSSAVISIWEFSRCVSALPEQFIRSLPPSSDPDLLQAFRSNFELVTGRFLRDEQSEKWDFGQVGELCATAALALLHDAFTRLADDVESVVKSAWRNRARRPARRSLRLTDRAKNVDANCGQYSTSDGAQLPPFPQTFMASLAHKVIDRLVTLADPFCRKTIEEISGEVVMHYPCGVDSKRSTYERFLTHKKSTMAQIMTQIHNNDSLIRVRHMGHNVDYFRSVALELSRTVPLGLLDKLNITQFEWETMKQHMLGAILTKLAPLYKKLDALLIDPIPRNELLDQVNPESIDAGAEWIGKEIDYPIWWEKCGVEKSIIDHRPESRFCSASAR